MHIPEVSTKGNGNDGGSKWKWIAKLNGLCISFGYNPNAKSIKHSIKVVVFLLRCEYEVHERTNGLKKKLKPQEYWENGENHLQILNLMIFFLLDLSELRKFILGKHWICCLWVRVCMWGVCAWGCVSLSVPEQFNCMPDILKMYSR